MRVKSTEIPSGSGVQRACTSALCMRRRISCMSDVAVKCLGTDIVVPVSVFRIKVSPLSASAGGFSAMRGAATAA